MLWGCYDNWEINEARFRVILGKKNMFSKNTFDQDNDFKHTTGTTMKLF